eukprot:5205531-Amphidinium_carterae.1
MAEPSSKVARLEGLRALRYKLPHITQSALAAVLKVASECSLPTAASRATIRAARDVCATESTPYGPLHAAFECTLTSGGTVKLECQHPMAMMYYLCCHSASYAMMVKRAHDQNPSGPTKPWNIIVYSDEITPGNQLASVNSRKLQAIYWSVLEYGMDVLSDEESWLELILCRSAVVQKVQGGMSGVVAKALEQFWETGAHDFAKAGIFVKLPDGSGLRLFLKFGMKLADESALHSAFGCKGSSGLKPCLLCQNIFNAKNERHLTFTSESWMQSHTCAQIGKQTHTIPRLELHMVCCFCLTVAEPLAAPSFVLRSGIG